MRKNEKYERDEKLLFCVWEGVKEKGKERVCVRERKSGEKGIVYVWERERDSEKDEMVCVCVWERERENYKK